MSPSLEQYWLRRARFLTQALILSGTLNIGLLTAAVYSLLKERWTTISYEVPQETKVQFSNEQVLRAYSKASFQDLLVRLESEDLVEDGYSKRDLALACLFAFHHFNVEKALGGSFLQKRIIAFRSATEEEMVELVAFVGLKKEQFEALIQFARREKWPFTSKGVFFELSRSSPPYDSGLLEAFYCTAEFHSLSSLVQKRAPGLDPLILVHMLKEGSWDQLKKFSDRLRVLQCYTEDFFREFLVSYALEMHSKIAAVLLIEQELDYAFHRLEDAQLMALLDLLKEKKEKIKPFALRLLTSSRSDDLRKKAADFLYTLEVGVPPTIYSYAEALQQFCPMEAPVPQTEPLPVAALETKELKKAAVHVVQPGDSLWKIAHKYGVKIETLKKVNHLESDSLRLGKELLLEGVETVSLSVVKEEKKKAIHVVQEGDSLWKIAKKYKVGIDAIRQLNHLESDFLRLGKELQIPESKS
jgi:LysM repeat protein